MLIKNVKIYTEDKKFVPGEMAVADGRFADPASAAADEVLDGEGCYMIPGLVDIHFHGCVGDDFCDAKEEAIANMAKHEASVGVTSICPATMTLSEEELHSIMKTAGAYNGTEGAKLVGINMEGPFISVKKKGAQAADYIRKCDTELFRKLQEESGGLIKLVDIAPENDGAIEFIRDVKDEVVVSIAHTVANYDEASRALAEGASHVTHLYNAMPPLNHREPGVIGAARDDDMFGADRIIMISDSMRATGLTDGQYTLGGQDVFVKGPLATLADGTIAGSATDLMGCIRVAVQRMGIPLEDAVGCATMNPAKEIGIYDRCGSIAPGKDADFVLLDEDLNVKAVYVNGKKQA